MKFTAIRNIIYESLYKDYGEQEAGGIARIYSEDKEFPQEATAIEKQRIIKEDIERLMQNYPVQYLVGKSYFFDTYFKVTTHTLIPRSETEELVSWIINENTALMPAILDIGTGSGCIPIILKKYIKLADVTALDISKEAIEVATENASAQNLNVKFLHLDFLNSLEWKKLPIYDVIVSNPPYIAKDEIVVMDQSAIGYEPELALFPAGDDPLIFYKSIAEFAKNHLMPGGKLFLELNEFYAEKIRDIFYTEYFSGVEIKMDLQGKKRMIKVLKKAM
jgi:release factor glutamine methyltransferase